MTDCCRDVEIGRATTYWRVGGGTQMHSLQLGERHTKAGAQEGTGGRAPWQTVGLPRGRDKPHKSHMAELLGWLAGRPGRPGQGSSSRSVSYALMSDSR